MRYRRFQVTCAILAVPCCASAQINPKPCDASERAIWWCTAGQKLYVLCASRDLSSKTGYLQYRVKKGSSTEFNFPSLPRHPRGLFSLSLMPRGAAFAFQNAEYRYTIYEPLIGQTVIDVAKSDRGLASITCGKTSDTLTLTETQQFFMEIGVFE
jgi:hypothetical protein